MSAPLGHRIQAAAQLRATPSMPVNAPPAMASDQRWDEARDVLVIRTGGKYAAIAELAVLLGMSSATVQARWHILRVR